MEIKKCFLLGALLALCTGGWAQHRAWGDTEDGYYRNPVLLADYSDPDAIRFGDRYYMVASDFHFMGMQVLESADLVNWKIVSQIYSRLDLPGWDTNDHYSGGSWAPSIRWHDGLFYVYFCTPDEGLFMSTASTPAGPWAPLHCVKSVYHWEDPCPFWDEDGQAYLGHSLHGAGPIIIHKMSPDGRQLLDDGVTVYRGPVAEGTKIHKWNGLYYMSIPEGGVGGGWQTVLRSRNIYGPYERKVVLERGSTPINGPHQGGWIHTRYGEDWFLHFQDKEAYGRVVHLNPVDWTSGWPVMGKKGEPVTTYKKPKSNAPSVVCNPAESDEFNSPTVGKQWQWQANYDEKFGMPTAFGTFRIYTYKMKADARNLWLVPNMLLQKTPADKFCVTTKLRMTAKAEGQMGGIIMMGLDYQALVVKRVGDEFQLLQLNCKKADKGTPQEEKVLATLKATEKDRTDYHPGIHEDIYLRMAVSDSQVCYYYSLNGKKFTECGDVFQMREGKWIGAKFGFVAVEKDQKADRGWIDADWIRVE